MISLPCATGWSAVPACDSQLLLKNLLKLVSTCLLMICLSLSQLIYSIRSSYLSQLIYFVQVNLFELSCSICQLSCSICQLSCSICELSCSICQLLCSFTDQFLFQLCADFDSSCTSLQQQQICSYQYCLLEFDQCSSCSFTGSCSRGCLLPIIVWKLFYFQLFQRSCLLPIFIRKLSFFQLFLVELLLDFAELTCLFVCCLNFRSSRLF